MNRLDILQAIKTQLQSILIVNDYNFNLGERVFYWQDFPFDYGEAGAITFRDTTEDLQKVNDRWEAHLQVEIDALKFSTNLLIDSCHLLDDLQRAIVRYNWSNVTIKFHLISSEKIIETQGKTAIKISLTVSFVYRTTFN